VVQSVAGKTTVEVSGLNDLGQKIRFLNNPFVEREAESNPFALTLNSDVT
jgi:hypothetical protein